MHDRLFANQKTLEPWTPHAEAIGLDVKKFDACMSSGKYAEEIRRNLAEGGKAGVTGTPAFFLAYTEPGSTKIKTVTRLVGAQPYAAFKAAIDKLLAAPPSPAETKPAPRSR